MDQVWQSISAFLGSDMTTFSVFGLNCWGMAVFWLWSLLFAAGDLLRPAWLMQFKVQEDPLRDLTLKRFWKAVRVVLFNQVVIGPALSMVSDRWRPAPPPASPA